MKVVFWVFGLAVGAVVLWVAWFLIVHDVICPWRYARLKTEAAEWNAENWENGHALRVTVQVQSRTTYGVDAADATLVCYQKKFAWPGGLKGGPGISTRTYSDGPAFLTVAFGPDAVHRTPLREVCRDTLRSGEDWELPFVTDSHYYWSDIVAEDHSFQCFLGNDPRTTKGEVTRPTFVAVERLTLRDLTERDKHMSLPDRLDEPVRTSATLFNWWLETSDECWREKQSDPCAPEIEAVCGRPLP